jgi:hypothetical protein
MPGTGPGDGGERAWNASGRPRILGRRVRKSVCSGYLLDYLVELQRHEAQVTEKPDEWMPWNYRETLTRLASIPAVN